MCASCTEKICGPVLIRAPPVGFIVNGGTGRDVLPAQPGLADADLGNHGCNSRSLSGGEVQKSRSLSARVCVCALSLQGEAYVVVGSC